MEFTELTERIQETSAWINPVKDEISKVLVGQKTLVDRLFVGLLCHGHILLEGVPGIAKTLAIKTLSETLGLSFSRLQFTPDLLPGDILGTMIYNPDERVFTPKLGPIFASLILADEINRAPAKVQSALLEAMQERQITLGETSYPLPEPFLVMATQNPIDQEGTYQLPEAQLDRFLLKVLVTYPTREEELQILDTMGSTGKNPELNAVMPADALEKSRTLIDQVYLAPAIRHYILDLVQATRTPWKIDPTLRTYIRSGASPRATISFALAARTHAFMNGRAHVTPQDIKDLALDILRHRILLSFEAEADNRTTDQIIGKILDKVPVP